MRTALVALALAGLGAPTERHVELSARYEPPTRPEAEGAIAVTLRPTTPDIQVNEEPAPRLKLDEEQKLLVDRQKPRKSATPVSFDPLTARYLDPETPVRFPVALAEGAPAGTHSVSLTVTYFYCSKSQGWCRKGNETLQVSVSVP